MKIKVYNKRLSAWPRFVWLHALPDGGPVLKYPPIPRWKTISGVCVNGESKHVMFMWRRSQGMW